MAPSCTPSFGQRHAQEGDQIIHVVETPPLSRLLEALDPPVPNLDAELVVEGYASPSSSPSYSPSIISKPTPEWSPITQPTLSNAERLTAAHATAPSVPVAAAVVKRKRDEVEDGENEDEEDREMQRKKAKRDNPHLTSYDQLIKAATGLKREREEANDDEDSDGQIRKKKAKKGPYQSNKSHHHSDTAKPAVRRRIGRSFKQQNLRYDSIVQRTERNRRFLASAAGRGGSLSASTPPWERLPAANDPLNGDIPTSPLRPPYSPITPSLRPSPHQHKSEADILRDGVVSVEHMPTDKFGPDALAKIDEWDEEFQCIRTKGPCQLPGLKELGLDTLYEVGQMEYFSWREKLFGGDGDGGQAKARGCQRFHGRRGWERVGRQAEGEESVVSGPRDFWSVVSK